MQRQRLRTSQIAACVLATLAFGLTGCGPTAEPIYDDALGFEAIPIDEGALEGTFALRTVSATLVTVPVLGDYLGGGVNYRKVTRTWDSEAGVYRQTSKLCGGYNFEVAGVVTGATQETYRSVPDSTDEVVTVDHERGTFETVGHVQLWGIYLDNPLKDPFPVDLAAANAPTFNGQIYDMDADNQPGITLFVSGAVDGELYAAQRKAIPVQKGLILGANLVRGTLETTYEQVTLGNNNALLDRASDGSAAPYPDPLESWFEEIRVDPTISCDDLIGLESSGELSRLRPF